MRPWLYRIARNRSLNHLRRVQAIGVDSMDVHLSEGGATTADKVHKREEFRLLVADVQDLPETQKTALLLREIDALSYEQIAEVMDTTIPSVKSLLVRARVSLAEAAEARLLSCEEVREELGEVAEGLRRSTAPARRHVRGCDRCQGFKAQLRSTNKALAAVYPVAPLLLFKKALLAHFGMTASAGAGSAAGAAAASVAATSGTSVMSAGISTIATKTAAGLAAAAIVTAGAVEVKHVQTKPSQRAVVTAQARPAPVLPAEPRVVASAQQPASRRRDRRDHGGDRGTPSESATPAVEAPAEPPAAAAQPLLESDPAAPATAGATLPADPALAPVQEESDSTTLTAAPGPPAADRRRRRAGRARLDAGDRRAHHAARHRRDARRSGSDARASGRARDAPSPARRPSPRAPAARSLSGASSGRGPRARAASWARSPAACRRRCAARCASAEPPRRSLQAMRSPGCEPSSGSSSSTG